MMKLSEGECVVVKAEDDGKSFLDGNRRTALAQLAAQV